MVGFPDTLLRFQALSASNRGPLDHVGPRTHVGLRRSGHGPRGFSTHLAAPELVGSGARGGRGSPQREMVHVSEVREGTIHQPEAGVTGT